MAEAIALQTEGLIGEIAEYKAGFAAVNRTINKLAAGMTIFGDPSDFLSKSLNNLTVSDCLPLRSYSCANCNWI